jgi:hypothetical protein
MNTADGLLIVGLADGAYQAFVTTKKGDWAETRFVNVAEVPGIVREAKKNDTPVRFSDDFPRGSIRELFDAQQQ